MNHNKLRAIRQAILEHRDRFCYRIYSSDEHLASFPSTPDCGTIGCVAGFALGMFATPEQLCFMIESDNRMIPYAMLGDVMELSQDQMDFLVYVQGKGVPGFRNHALHEFARPGGGPDTGVDEAIRRIDYLLSLPEDCDGLFPPKPER